MTNIISPQQVEILIEDWPLKGLRLAIGPSGRLTIGRRDPGVKDLDIAIPAEWVSILHATVTLEGGRLFVQDHDTTNGTLVRGQVIRDKKVEVAIGDAIQIAPPRGPRIHIRQRITSAQPSALEHPNPAPLRPYEDVLESRTGAAKEGNQVLQSRADEGSSGIDWALLDPMLADFVSRLERVSQQAEGELQVELRKAEGRFKEIRRILERGRRS